MITVQDFKKLLSLQEQGCVVFCDEEEVCLSYHAELDADEPEKRACNISFRNDRYGGIYSLLDEEYANAKWTVKKFTEIDWQALSHD